MWGGAAIWEREKSRLNIVHVGITNIPEFRLVEHL